MLDFLITLEYVAEVRFAVPLRCSIMLKCRCSSVVEHVIGNDGVVSPILISGTINKKASLKGAFLLMRIGDKKRTYDMIA